MTATLDRLALAYTEQALDTIDAIVAATRADPEVFDLDARAMRAHAQRAVHWAGDRS